MLETMSKYWWAIALRGLVAVLFGLFTFFVPGITLIYLVFLFGVYALLDGGFSLIASIESPSHHWALMLEGIVGILAGILTFIWPGITAVVLLYVIAFWAIFTGILELIAGVRLRRAIANEWMLILMGVASLIFGFLILMAPAAGALAIVIWIGAYALIFGIVSLILAFRLREAQHHLPGPAPTPHTV